LISICQLQIFIANIEAPKNDNDRKTLHFKPCVPISDFEKEKNKGNLEFSRLPLPKI